MDDDTNISDAGTQANPTPDDSATVDPRILGGVRPLDPRVAAFQQTRAALTPQRQAADRVPRGWWRDTTANAVPDVGSINQWYQQQNMTATATERAVKQATAYQGHRGYQQDLAQGMEPAKALAKWAPLLFYNTPGQMAAATQKAQPKPPPQMTPYQQQEIAMRKQAMEAKQAAAAPEVVAKKKLDAAHFTDAQSYVREMQRLDAAGSTPETKANLARAIKERDELLAPPAPARPAGPPPVIPNVPPVQTYRHTPSTAPWPLPRAGGTISRVQPAAKPASNPPAPAGAKEGQKFRNKKTGKTGTVRNGVIVPDAQ